MPNGFQVNDKLSTFLKEFYNFKNSMNSVTPCSYIKRVLMPMASKSSRALGS
jgi:hypothetical protein